jgi:putative phage-type endonuclease
LSPYCYAPIFLFFKLSLQNPQFGKYQSRDGIKGNQINITNSTSPPNVEARTINDRNEWLRWRQDTIGASEVAAVFGLSPFQTPLDLFIAKTQRVTVDETAIMKRGRILEAAGLAALQIEKPEWHCRPAGFFLSNKENRISATPDFVTIDNEPVELKAPTPRTFETEWTVEPPLYHQLQALTQAVLLGAERAWIAALIVDRFSAELTTYEIPRNAAVETKIKNGVRAFWQRIKDNNPPPPTFGSDADSLAALWPTDRGPMLDMTGDNRMAKIVDDRASCRMAARRLEKAIEEIDDEIKTKIGGAEGAFGDGWRVTWKTEHRAASVRPAQSFRVLRINQKRKATDNG